jgi:hypothetical protein
MKDLLWRDRSHRPKKELWRGKGSFPCRRLRGIMKKHQVRRPTAWGKRQPVRSLVSGRDSPAVFSNGENSVSPHFEHGTSTGFARSHALCSNQTRSTPQGDLRTDTLLGNHPRAKAPRVTLSWSSKPRGRGRARLPEETKLTEFPPGWEAWALSFAGRLGPRDLSASILRRVGSFPRHFPGDRTPFEK